MTRLGGGGREGKTERSGLGVCFCNIVKQNVTVFCTNYTTKGADTGLSTRCLRRKEQAWAFPPKWEFGNQWMEFPPPGVLFGGGVGVDNNTKYCTTARTGNCCVNLIGLENVVERIVVAHV